MADWNITYRVKIRVGGNFYGRHVIGRDTPINEGVYPGDYPREVIVVDFDKDPYLQDLYQKVIEAATEPDGTFNKGKVLSAVFTIVKDSMRPDANGVERVVQEYGASNDGLILLGVFINNKVGVCIHYALACAVILERLRKEGYVRGKPSVDRNKTDLGKHAWCRYTNSAGEVFILDPALGYIGPLDGPNAPWDYKRPEDYASQRNLQYHR
jgi:hypothetical protein